MVYKNLACIHVCMYFSASIDFTRSEIIAEIWRRNVYLIYMAQLEFNNQGVLRRSTCSGYDITVPNVEVD